jgi:hypothetical protein
MFLGLFLEQYYGGGRCTPMMVSEMESVAADVATRRLWRALSGFPMVF